MPVVLEKGAKRERKSVQRLAFQSPSNEDKKAFTVEQGKGTPLGEIPYSRFNYLRAGLLKLFCMPFCCRLLLY